MKRFLKPKQETLILAQGLARIASNLGRGSIHSSEHPSEADALRLEASVTLKSVGYTYKENPDGWYDGDKLIIPMD